MKLEKIKKTYNDYKLELSFGQLEAIRDALEAKHDDPVLDELLAEWDYYLAHVPGPGEEEEDAKTRANGGMPTPEDEEGGGLPMPPTEGEAPAEPGAAPEAPAPGGLEAPPKGELEGGEGGEDITADDLAAVLSGDAPVPEFDDDEAEPDLAAPPAE